MNKINVLGAGLAGCEAALQIAARGIYVDLYEMKPLKRSPAHHMDSFAELVCSNSLKAERVDSAAGLLKTEMRRFGSVCMAAADTCRVPAGGALAVDRDVFSDYITRKIKENPFINVIEKVVTDIPEGVTEIGNGAFSNCTILNKVYLPQSLKTIGI